MEETCGVSRRRKQLNVYVPEILHYTTKVQALMDGMTISSYVEAALKERMWRSAMPRADDSFHLAIHEFQRRSDEGK